MMEQHVGRAHSLLHQGGAFHDQRGRVMIDQYERLARSLGMHRFHQVRHRGDVDKVDLLRGGVQRESLGASGRGGDERYLGRRKAVKKDGCGNDAVNIASGDDMLVAVIPRKATLSHPVSIMGLQTR